MSRPRVLAAVVLMGALSACSQRPAPVPAGELTAVEAVDGSIAVVRPPPEGPGGGTEALVLGELAVLDGGCLGFRDEDGGQTLVVWPSRTTALPDVVGVDVPGMGAYQLGDAVEGAGGYGDAVLGGPAGGCPSTEAAWLNEDQRP